MPEIIGNRYVLLDGEGKKGGLSTVRKAMDTRGGGFVAVKFVDAGKDEISQKVFEREVETLRSLSHPNIVEYRDSGSTDDGTNYLVLEWVDLTLVDWLEQHPWDSWDAFYQGLARPLLAAVSHAHLQRVEHRDLKPLNILVNSDGSPKVADFGIAKLGGQSDSSEITVAGFRSGIYAPREMDSTLPYVRDVYSLGVLFIQCLSREKLGDYPDIAKSLEIINVPPDTRRVIEACISDDPDERPENAVVLSGLLERVSSKRVASSAQGRNAIRLSLTNTAVEHLLAPSAPDRREARAKMQADLSGTVFAGFRIDLDSGEPDRGTVILVGDEFRYTLKRDDRDSSAFVVTAAYQPELEALEGRRRQSLQLPPIFSWAVSDPGQQAAAQRGMDLLLELLDDHISRGGTSDTEAPPREGDELFDLWARILDAREELARGNRKPMSYSSVQAEDHQATFHLVDDCDIDLIGTEWQVKDQQSGRKFGWGEVIEQDGTELTLAGRRFRTVPRSASLVPHIGPSEASLRRQRDAVTSVRLAANPRPELREILLEPENNREPSSEIVTSWGTDLDQSKRDAVSLALGTADLLLVQGPPGTGKTSFITETVAQFLHKNPKSRVLIASQTHVAVDNALERLDRAGVSGLVRLAGVDPLRVHSSVRHLLLDAQLRKWAQRVNASAEANINARAVELGLSPAHARAALILQELALVNQEIEDLERRLEQETDKPEGQDSDLSTAMGLDDIDNEIQSKLDSLRDRRPELEARAQAALAGDLTIPPGIDAEGARSALDVLLVNSPRATEHLSRMQLQAEWLSRMYADDDGLAAAYLTTTSVVAGTCTGFLRNPAVGHLEFDMCIVDEASKATLTEALVPISRARKWILVGDTRQLPPTDEDLLRAGDLLTDKQISTSDVQQTLFQRMADRLPPHSQRMLTEQYRMVRPIGDLISTCFYEGRLKSPRTDELDGYRVAVGPPVVWRDTSRLGESRRESAPEGQATSFANRVEARLIARQLETLERSIGQNLIKSPHPGGKLEVLVVSPYKSQVETLRHLLARSSFANLAFDVMSVDSVQGRECDICLFSVTRSNNHGGLGFLGQDYWRRINVALSRSRFGLVIVGDAEFIKSTNGALKNVLGYIKEHPMDCEVRVESK